MLETGWYEHFKGGKYEVTGISTHTETEEHMVEYTGQDGRRWVRPLKMFCDFVKKDEKSKEKVPRFKYIGRFLSDR